MHTKCNIHAEQTHRSISHSRVVVVGCNTLFLTYMEA